MNILEVLQSEIALALNNLFEIEIDKQTILLEPTKKDFDGNLTFVVFPFVKQAKLSPEVLANKIGDHIKSQSNAIDSFNVVKGFLNISIASSYYVHAFTDYIHNDLKPLSIGSGSKVMVEYSSPNTNKPLHLGHLRNNFLGYSISQILKANGYDVVKANLINDRGIHICKSMIAYMKFGNNETPEKTGIKGDHLVGKYYVTFDKKYKEEISELVANGIDEEQAKKEAPIFKEAQQLLLKWEQGDNETYSLWEKMNGWVYDGFNATYKNIGVSFDHFYYESNTYLLGKDIVDEGLSKNVFYKKEDGSVWIDLTDEGLDHKLLLRSDGTSVYITQDLGTAELKYKDFSCSKSIYVVGNEQDYHFQVLQLILKKLNKPYAPGVYHMSYGMVDLPSGKMKSREGTVVDADDLIQEMIDTAKSRTVELGKIEDFESSEAYALYNTLGLGALKYYLLKVDPKKRMLFNPAESIDFQGNTGPFIQYTYARIQAMLRKAESLSIPYQSIKLTENSYNKTELELIELLLQYSIKVEEAGKLYSPSIIASYVFEIAKMFNSYYSETPVFTESSDEIKALRLKIYWQVSKTIQQLMLLLGIDVPNKM
jgi:arginyl-tRNA synthetase